jgi:hypothetical protein
MDKLEKIECQELGMDPSKTYIVNLYFDESIDRNTRQRAAEHYKAAFESKGFTNLIFNTTPELCKVEVQGVQEE